MSFHDSDKKLQDDVRQKLFLRQTINANLDIGKAYLQAEPEDRINPSVRVTKEDIRKQTGREKIRDVVLEEYAQALKAPGIAVERIDGDTLQVTMVPIRAAKNDFLSLAALEAENAADLERDPELGEPMY